MAKRRFDALPALVLFAAATSTQAAHHSSFLSTGATAARPAPTPSSSTDAGEISGKDRAFVQEIERDFPLRSIGQLQITNLRGPVTIQGWAQDKIRVRARRTVTAGTEAEARKLFSTIDFRFKSAEGNIELSAEYGRGLEIHDRMQERENPKTSMEMIVFAPANLKLKVWTVDDRVSVRAWNEALMVRTTRGAVQIENVKGREVSVLCDRCGIQFRSIHANVRSMSSEGGVDLSEILGSQVYVESGAGAINAFKISGDQLYVTKSGNIIGRDLHGNVEFHSRQGSVEIQDGSGFLSGSTETGAIKARMKEWRFTDKAFIESNDGSIQLMLPADFSGDLDIWSVRGNAEIGFPLKHSREHDTVGPEPTNHFTGQVGDGGEHLKVYSDRGDVRVLKAL